jgi:hypothetical protein
MDLAMLHESLRYPRHLEAAQRVADFLIERVFPRNTWHDSELFFSCSQKRPGWRDARTGIPTQSTFPLAWTAELMRLLYLATRSGRYLEHGRAALDLLLLYQQAGRTFIASTPAADSGSRTPTPVERRPSARTATL